MVAVLYQRFGFVDALMATAALVAQLVAVARWAARFDRFQVLANYRHVMRLSTLTAASLVLYLGARLVAG